MKKVRLHHEGVGLLVSFSLTLVLACWATFVFVLFKGVFTLILPVSLMVMGLALSFFRFPKRSSSGATNRRLTVASVDGKVVVMGGVEGPELLGCRCLKLSIFMSLYNVYANWAACNDTATHVKHQNGAYYGTFLPKNSVFSERSAVITRMDGGHEVLECQIAGVVTRRIVAYPKVGDEVTVEDFLGFTKFGSHVGLYLPLDTETAIKIGDEVVDDGTTLDYLPQ